MATEILRDKGWLSPLEVAALKEKHKQELKEKCREFADVLHAEARLDISMRILNGVAAELFRQAPDKFDTSDRPDLMGYEEPDDALALYLACKIIDAADDAQPAK